MKCPTCEHTNSRVLESRSTELGASIRRRRECLECGYRFTTYERVEWVPITVLKRNGHRESFERSKVLQGMVRACEKTNIPQDHLEQLVADLESQIQQRSCREIASAEIGELVLSLLRPLNEVAYIRFASVHQQFHNLRDFMTSLEALQSTANPDPDFPQAPDRHWDLSLNPH